MARTARKPPEGPEEVKEMDFERAKKLYFHDIKPAKSEASSQGQTVAEAMKVIKKSCYIEPQGAKGAFKAFEMEDAHREIHLRSFAGMLNALLGFEAITCNFGDLVDQAQGKPKTDRYARPKLVTLPAGTPSDGEETDLADAAEDDFEASEAELAQQQGRGEQKPGTVASAIAAMKAAGTSSQDGQED